MVFTYDLLRDWFIPKHNNKNDLSQSLPSPPPTLSKQKFKIVAEQFVSINHYFLSNAKNLSEIKTLYSHPQVWGQITSFLNKADIVNLNLNKIDTSSTSKAAELVKNDDTNTSACICSKVSADLYNLPIISERIEDNSNNSTRFLVLGYNKPPPSIAILNDKPNLTDISSADVATSTSILSTNQVTSIMFTLNHNDPGALCTALDSFKIYNINLASISSRPSHIKQWQYVFFIEAVGSYDDDKNIKSCIESLSDKCLDLVILGSFERSWRYWS